MLTERSLYHAGPQSEWLCKKGPTQGHPHSSWVAETDRVPSEHYKQDPPLENQGLLKGPCVHRRTQQTRGIAVMMTSHGPVRTFHIRKVYEAYE